MDCFSGSGTTLAAAQKMGRRWIGVDMNESAIKVAEKRLLELSKKAVLFASPISFSVIETA
jgi:DNA modification methylase